MLTCPVCGRSAADDQTNCAADGALLVAAKLHDPLIGHVIEERYKLVEIVGRGGFGTVYRAAHQRLPRDFAVKLLSPVRAADPRQVARFRQEVRAVCVIQHANVIEVIDFGYDVKVGYFVVMPLLEGETLLDRLNRESKLPIVDIHTILLAVAAGLGSAHGHRVVHRDIKVENIFLARDNHSPRGFAVKILDFGVAKLLSDGMDEQVITASNVRTGLTQVVGTPLTMSPEQVRGAAVDVRSDMYSLGVVLYEMLTAAVPFNSANTAELMRMHVQDAPPRPSSSDAGEWIPPELDELLLAMLAKKPDDRPQNMGELLQRWQAIRSEVDEAWAAHHLVELRHPPQRGDQSDPYVPQYRDKTGNITQSRQNTISANARKSTSVDAAATAHLIDGPRVLIVDDDESICNLVRLILHNARWTSASAQSGQAALQWLAQHPKQPDVVVLDMLMPGMDGLTTLKKMREAGFKMPVVFCTSLQSAAVRGEAEAQGNVAFLTKGQQLHQLAEVLEQLGLSP